jgi:D-alanyl-D-alanine carboxypeptidase
MVAEAAVEKSEPKAVEKPEPKAVAKVEPKVEPKVETKPEPKVAAKVEPKTEAKDQHRFAVASMSSTPVKLDQPAAKAAANEPIRPVPVRTVTVRPGVTQTAGLAPINVPTPPAQVAAAAPASPTAPKVAAVVAPQAPVVPVAAKVEAIIPPPPGARPGVLGVLPARSAAAEPSMPATGYAPAAVTAPAKPPVARSGWMIQVGAFGAEQEAKQRLSALQTKAGKVLDGTDPFTESVEKGDKTFYRARFAGFDKDKAEAACKVLKRDGVECVTIRN